MGRKIEIDVLELLDCFFAGLDGDWHDYLFCFLRDDCRVTMEDVKELTLQYLHAEGYGEEDYQYHLEIGKEWFDRNS